MLLWLLLVSQCNYLNNFVSSWKCRCRITAQIESYSVTLLGKKKSATITKIIFLLIFALQFSNVLVFHLGSLCWKEHDSNVDIYKKRTVVKLKFSTFIISCFSVFINIVVNLGQGKFKEEKPEISAHCFLDCYFKLNFQDCFLFFIMYCICAASRVFGFLNNINVCMYFEHPEYLDKKVSTNLQ